MVYCSKCGVQNDENNNVCTACGAELVKPEVNDIPVNEPNDSYYAQSEPASESKGEISTLAFIGIFILFMIPVVGLVFAIVWACNGTSNKTLVNFSRASLVVMAVCAVIAVIAVIFLITVLGLVGGEVMTRLPEILRELEGVNITMN